MPFEMRLTTPGRGFSSVTDDSVRAALRSDAPLVLVEAPAGCDKTHQGADFARETAVAGNSGRLLILTHTHAACSTFSARAKGVGSRIEIRTIDSLIGQIASYHAGLQLPADIPSWIRQRERACRARCEGGGALEQVSDGCGLIGTTSSHRHL